MNLIAILILLFTGIVFGIWITLNILRKLGNRAHKSAVSQELFYKLTHYRCANYHLHSNGEVESVTITQNEETQDDVSLEDALKQLGYKKEEITKALDHVSKVIENGTIGDKLKESLKFIGGNV